LLRQLYAIRANRQLAPICHRKEGRCFYQLPSDVDGPLKRCRLASRDTEILKPLDDAVALDLRPALTLLALGYMRDLAGVGFVVVQVGDASTYDGAELAV
jgi:hypothetical protein